MAQNNQRIENRNVLLVNPSGWQKESINLGISYLASSLFKEGFEVQVLDLNRYELKDSEILEQVAAFNPFHIGISLKTATAIEGARVGELIAQKMPEVFITAGGPHFTLCAESFLRENPAFSFGIMGEGEESFSQLVKTSHEGGDWSHLKGVVWRNGQKVIINEWSPPSDLDSLPIPNLDVIQGFSWEGFRYPIVSSRGCPHDCTYCCVNKLTGSRKWRSRSPKNVVGELELLVRSKGITSFEIWDDNFTLNMKRAKAICRLIIERGLKLSWYCHNGIRADCIDDELAKLMHDAGCTSIAFGMETGNPHIFDSIKKGEPLSAVVEAVKKAKKVGIQTVGYFIIGLPGDNLRTFINTVRFEKKLKLNHATYGMLIPYPHTEVWDDVNARGTFLTDITGTQHFCDDVVPVSFELPDFPKSEKVRAHYISKFLDLYESVERVYNQTGKAKVFYIGAEQYLDKIAGMVTACHGQAQHEVIGDITIDSLREHKGFGQVPEDTIISTNQHYYLTKTDSSHIYVCPGSKIPRNIILGNLNLVLINTNRPLCQTVQVKKWIKLPLPGIISALLGTILSAPDAISYFGFNKVYTVAKSHLASQARHVKLVLADKARHTVPVVNGQLQAINKTEPELAGSFIKQESHKGLLVRLYVKNYLLKRWAVNLPFSWALIIFKRVTLSLLNINKYAQLKAKLYALKHKKSEYPFENYPSYL